MKRDSAQLVEYQRLVEKWVLDAVAAGSASLDSIVRSLPGVYPGVVAQTVENCRETGKISASTATKILGRTPALREDGREPSSRTMIPLAHPADYEWHFVSDSAEMIVELCERYVQDDGAIALLGVPTVAIAYSDVRARARKIDLFDRDAAVIERINEYCPGITASTLDVLREAPPAVEASVVVMDPPWYTDYMRFFFSVAAALCKGGGHVVVSVPPDGTRPGMDDEWSRLVAWADRLGLELVERRRAALAYVTPYFEVNALRAEGVSRIGTTWRRGDLAIFRLAAISRSAAPPTPLVEPNWSEIQVGLVRIKLRQGRPVSSLSSDPRLKRLVKGDVMPTVSRHNKYRAKIDVWTCGNRIYRCSDMPLLERIIGCLRSGDDVLELRHTDGSTFTNVEAAWVKETYREVQSLIEIERREAERWTHDVRADLPQIRGMEASRAM